MYLLHVCKSICRTSLAVTLKRKRFLVNNPIQTSQPLT